MLAVNLGESTVELEVEPGLDIAFDSGGARLARGRVTLEGLTAALLVG